MSHNTYSVYVVAIILFIISLPILLVGGIVSIVQEAKRVREARLQGEQLSYLQPKLLAGIAVILFVLTVTASGALYVSITYKLLSASLNWAVVALLVLAGIFGLLYLMQVISGNNRAQKSSQ